MANEFGMPNRRLSFTTIFNNITKQGKTIEELASRYGMSEETFRKELEMGLGPKMYPKVVDADKKNQKNRERKTGNNRKTAQGKLYQPKAAATEVTVGDKEEESMAVKNNTRKNATKGNASKAATNKTATTKAATPKAEKTEPTIEEVRAKYESIKIQMESAKDILDSAATIMQLKQQDCATAKMELDAAQKKYAEATAAEDKAIKEYNTKCEDYQKRECEFKAISQQLEEMERKIYLIAPGYKGTIPAYGKFISTTRIKDLQVEVKKGELLMNEPTYQAVVESGYKNLDDFHKALEFAKLCVMYMTGKTPATILVDDERMKNVLRFQGLLDE